MQDLVHPFWTQRALDQVSNGDGTDKGREPGIFALLLGGAVAEDLRGAKGRLEEGRKLSDVDRGTGPVRERKQLSWGFN